MLHRRIVLAGCLVLLCAALVLADNDAPATAPAASAPAFLVEMKYTSGWGRGVIEAFQMHPDGTFRYFRAGLKQPPVHLHGQMSSENVLILMKQIRTAGPGPIAEDAGTVQFVYLDEEGKQQTKTYQLPNKSPCAEIVHFLEICVNDSAQSDVGN